MLNICSNITEEIKTTYDCAKVCFNTPSAPIADYIVSGFNLISTSIFYSDEKLYKWQIYDGNILLYDSGWGEGSDLMPDFYNGSVFSNIYLGINNSDIVSLLYLMGFYIKQRTLSIAHLAMGENGKVSEKTIKYFFNETN